MKLPNSDFRWEIQERIDELNSIIKKRGRLNNIPPSILEVDLEYPSHFNDLYPLAPEKIKIGKVGKLIPNFMKKEEYLIHHEILKCFINMGLTLTKVYRVITFEESDLLKPYIAFNTYMRAKLKTVFEKIIYKLMNNALF